MKKSTKIVIAVASAIGVLLIGLVLLLVLLKGNNPYQAHLKAAARYLDEMDYEQAIAEYRAAIDLEPYLEEAYEMLASLFADKEDYVSAANVIVEGIYATNSKSLRKDLEELVDDHSSLEQYFDPDYLEDLIDGNIGGGYTGGGEYGDGDYAGGAFGGDDYFAGGGDDYIVGGPDGSDDPFFYTPGHDDEVSFERREDLGDGYYYILGFNSAGILIKKSYYYQDTLQSYEILMYDDTGYQYKTIGYDAAGNMIYVDTDDTHYVPGYDEGYYGDDYYGDDYYDGGYGDDYYDGGDDEDIYVDGIRYGKTVTSEADIVREEIVDLGDGFYEIEGYDAKGQFIKHSVYDSNWVLLYYTISGYDIYGNQTEWTEYDSNGNVVDHYSVHETYGDYYGDDYYDDYYDGGYDGSYDGDFSDGAYADLDYDRVDLEYNSDGSIAEMITYYVNGQVCQHDEYDKNGTIQKSTQYYANGNLSMMSEYDREGNLATYTYYELDGSYGISEYYPNGIGKRSAYYGRNGQLISLYEYDMYGNLINEVIN